MTGARRTTFAGLAAMFRGLSFLPLGLAKGLERVADWCEERAR